MILPIHAKLLSEAHTFTLAEAQRYVSEVRETGAIESDKRFKKRFLEEFWPLTAIAQCVGNEHTRLLYQGSSKKVDAQLLLRDSSPQPIEFTIAFDAEQEALRDEHFEKYRHAPVTAILPRPSGTRASGKREMPEVEAEVWSRPEQQDAALGRMINALAQKKKAALSRPGYRNAWLGIVVVNWPPDQIKREFYDPLGQRFLASPADYAPFGRVFLASTVGDYVFDSATMTGRFLASP